MVIDADKAYKMKIVARREVKRRILETASELIREQGVANVTLDQIAEKLHISKVSIYHHWTSKKEIIFDLVRIAYKLVIERLEKIVKDADTPDIKLRRAIENHVSQAVISGVGTMLPLHDLQITSKHKKDIVKLRDTYEDLLYQLIDEGVRKGIFRKIDIKLFIYTMVGAANYAWVWYSPKGSMSLSEISNHMSDTLLNGILSTKGQNTRK